MATDAPKEIVLNAGDLIVVRDAGGRPQQHQVERAQCLGELLGSIWLYVDWRYVTTQLTTEQKELWADAVDATTDDPDFRVDRWWRS